MYFNNCKTIEALKREYKRLAYIHHPDRGGDTETMQAINAEYDRAFARLRNVHESTRSDAQPGDTYESAEASTEAPEEYREIIERLLHLDGVELELCGRWIWITGSTYQHRESLKAAGCKWASKKRCWYWHPSDAATRSRRSTPMDKIRERYGSESLGTGRSYEAITA